MSTKASSSGKPKSKAKTAPINSTEGAIEAYMKRIGATQRNFRRWVVKESERDGYERDAHVITLKSDGEMDWGYKTPDEIKPTLEEKRAIKVAILVAILVAIQEKVWPKSIEATFAQVEQLRAKLLKEQGEPPTLFVFQNEAGKGVLFVQQRIFGKKPGEKKKHDYPWSFWNDSQWHMMEPDGLLPLFGLEQLKKGGRIFIHEGAKGGEFLQKLTADDREPEWKEARAGCPWLPELRRGAHLGWPGGAPNADRVDWEPIRRLPSTRSVVIVCDNDPGGMNAAPKISRMLKRKLQVIRFSEDFDRGFDLADPFPLELYKGKKDRKIYMGPSLLDCLEGATWATKPIMDGKEVIGHELTREFIEEWLFTVKPLLFMNRSNLVRRYNPEEFNASQAPFSDVKDITPLLKSTMSAKAEQPVYEPGRKSGPITFKGNDGRTVRAINCYVPSGIVPKVDYTEADVQPWLDFLKHLFPNAEDCHEMMRWDATMIARPEVRMAYGVLLISNMQGVGKTTHADVLMRLIGRHNCSTPNAEAATEPKFTTWRIFKRLAVIGEIYDGQNSKSYNRLKDSMTDAWVKAEEKYEKEYYIHNFVQIHASSNSLKALKLDDKDRRWLVPEVTEIALPEGYWLKFYAWLDAPGTEEAIAAWAEAYVQKHGAISPARQAPSSITKRRAIEAAQSDGEQIICELGRILKERKEYTVLRRDEIRQWLASKKAKLNSNKYGDDGERLLEMAEKIRWLLKGCGLCVPDKAFEERESKFRVVANFEIDKAATWARDLKAKSKTPGEIEQEEKDRERL